MNMARTVAAVKVFQSKGFAKTARKAGIGDAELRDAFQQILKGQCDDLGGGVLKKRLNKNEYRAIILAKGGERWIYEFLFAKKDRGNIEDDELKAFRKLAADYAGLTEAQMSKLIKNGDVMEIRNGK